MDVAVYGGMAVIFLLGVAWCDLNGWFSQMRTEVRIYLEGYGDPFMEFVVRGRSGRIGAILTERLKARAPNIHMSVHKNSGRVYLYVDAERSNMTTEYAYGFVRAVITGQMTSWRHAGIVVNQ